MPLIGNGIAPAATDSTKMPGSWLVDLRWVQTHVRRAAAAAEVTEEAPVADREPVRLARAMVQEPSIFVEPVVMPGVPAAWHPLSAMPKETTVTLEAVMSMCQRWRQQQDVVQR